MNFQWMRIGFNYCARHLILTYSVFCQYKTNLQGLVAISSSIAELAGKAREGKLQPQEFVGGTFTISNLGMYGIKHFTAVINPPQVLMIHLYGSVIEHRNGDIPH